MTVDPRSTALGDLATASRILFDQGILDAFGHVSMRDPKSPDQFLISRNMAPGLVTTQDIMTLDMNGNTVGETTFRPFLERFIHSGIYKARSDVHAVVHSHSPNVIPYTISRSTHLRPVCHMSGFIPPQPPLYEVRDHGHHNCDMLIRTQDMGDELARELAEEPMVLMRGHGITVVGPDLKLAVFRAVYTEFNAKIQAGAMLLGDYTALSHGEAKSADMTNSGQNQRAWDLWALQAAKNGLSPISNS